MQNQNSIKQSREDNLNILKMTLDHKHTIVQLDDEIYTIIDSHRDCKLFNADTGKICNKLCSAELMYSFNYITDSAIIVSESEDSNYILNRSDFSVKYKTELSLRLIDNFIYETSYKNNGYKDLKIFDSKGNWIGQINNAGHIRFENTANPNYYIVYADIDNTDGKYEIDDRYINDMTILMYYDKETNTMSEVWNSTYLKSSFINIWSIGEGLYMVVNQFVDDKEVNNCPDTFVYDIKNLKILDVL
jgi:hypothetical protein